MENNDKKVIYEKLHKRLGDKYGIPPSIVKHIRSSSITGKKSREEILTSFKGKIESRKADMERTAKHMQDMDKALSVLPTLNEDQYKELVKK